jgi:hypothetical protein
MSRYKDLERLAAAAERAGGYGHTSGTPAGDVMEVVVDGEVERIEGRDVVTFLQILLRRSQARETELRDEGRGEYDNAALTQQLQDGRREVAAAAVREALERFER